MDNTLQAILLNTYNVDNALRSQAEAALIQLLNSPGFLSAFVNVMCNGSLHRDLRLSATIIFKNNIRDIWTTPNSTEVRDTNKPQFPSSEDERNTSKENILQLLLSENDNSIRKLLAECVRVIAEFDFPDRWPTLMPTLFAGMQQSENTLMLHNALLGFRKILKRYEFKKRDDRHLMNALIDTMFPTIQTLLVQLVDNNLIEASHILRICLKIFWSCTHYALPNIQAGAVVDIHLWFKIIGQILQKPLPEASTGQEPVGQPTEESERRQWPWWKLKKWAGRLITTFIQRYGNPKYTEECYVEFSKYFASVFAVQLLQPVFQVLSSKSSGSFVTDEVHINCISFVSNCSEMSVTYKVVKPLLRDLLVNVIFPTLCLSQAEIKMFSEDPSEFMHKIHNPWEEFVDPRNAAGYLLQTLAKYRQKDVLPIFLPFVQNVLSEYNSSPPEARNYIQKDGVLVMVAKIFKILSESKSYNSVVEPFILHHVLPEFQSPVHFLRYRACWVVEYFTNLHFETAGLLETVTQGLLSGMRDPAIPVQAASACSLRMLLESKEIAEMLRPLVPQIVSEYFRIMEEVTSDEVLSALQVIVTEFGEEILGIAPDIVSRLLQIFAQYNSEDEGDDEAEFMATQCLDTITAVMSAVQEDPNAITLLEPILLPVIHSLLTNADECFAYIEQVIEMLSYFTFYGEPISPATWEFCGLLIESANDWAFDYLSEIFAPISNFVTRGISVFICAQYKEKSMVLMLLELLSKALTCDLGEYELEPKLAMSMLSAFVMTCKSIQSTNPINDLIPHLLAMIVPRLSLCKTKGLKIKLLEVIMSCFYYDAPYTMLLFGSSDPTTVEVVWSMLFDLLTDMHKPVSRRLIVLSFCNILLLPANSLPVVLQNNFQPMLQQVIRELVFIEEEVDEEEEEEDASAAAGRAFGGDGTDDEIDEVDDDNEEEDGDEDKEESVFQDAYNIPEGGFGEDEDVVNVEDENYKLALDKVEKETRVKEELRRAGTVLQDDDEEEDEDELIFTTPVETLDCVLYFLDALQALNDKDPQLAMTLRSQLDHSDEISLQQFIDSAQERRSKL